MIATAPAQLVPIWQPARWKDYLALRDAESAERNRLFFNQGHLLVEMGAEGINHASVGALLPILFFIWFSAKRQSFKLFGGCQLEKTNNRAAAPDQIVYLGENVPQWREGEPRRISLDEWRVPNLVGEIADTTLATDLDEKKRLYASLGIPEYWVIDVQGRRLFAFQLQAEGGYQQIETSQVMMGLPIALLEGAIQRLMQGSTDQAAIWFAQQIEVL